MDYCIEYYHGGVGVALERRCECNRYDVFNDVLGVFNDHECDYSYAIVWSDETPGEAWYVDRCGYELLEG